MKTDEGLINIASKPKYVFLKEELIRHMRQGAFSPEGRLPSESELCRTYGLSQMTVRRALADLVHEGRVMRIKGKGSFEVSVVPDSQGGTQKSFMTSIISLVLMSYEPTDSSIINIISGVQGCLSVNDYSVTVECSNLNPKTEVEILDKCIKNRVDGVLIFALDPEKNAAKLASLEVANIPVVMIDRMASRLPCTMVCSYHMDGMYQMARYLLELGHRRIAYVTAGIPTHVNTDRLAGYKAALEQRGIPFEEELCLLFEKLDFEKIVDLIKNKRITAIACINDETAIKVMRLLRDRGYDVPKDISVSGFDDNVSASYANLTTIRQHYKEIGAEAAARLLDRIRLKTGHSQTFFPVDLVVRTSTAAPSS